LWLGARSLSKTAPEPIAIAELVEAEASLLRWTCASDNITWNASANSAKHVAVGIVHEGQDAEIKIDTFSFTRYGLLHGSVIDVSQDAIARDKPQDKSGDKSQGTEAASSEPKGQELNYAARVSLDRTQMQVEDKLVNLTPGMAVTVEIKTGSRRIISYLLSPLVRYKQEMLRER